MRVSTKKMEMVYIIGPPAAGIDEATPQMPKRLTAKDRQSDARSSCRALAVPISACGVARKARTPPPKKFISIPKHSFEVNYRK